MALFSECSLKCARKVLDTADIVREAILHPARQVKRDYFATQTTKVSSSS